MHIINCASLSRLVRYGSCSVLVVLTIMTGHRSLAEIYAKLVLSEVIASAADVRLAVRRAIDTHGSRYRIPF